MSDKQITASDRWFILGFTVLTAVNLLTILYTPLDLSPDEAYYAVWSKDIDWAYYSKGPAIAVLIRASTILFGSSDFAVRLPAVLCHAFFSLLLFVFVRQLVGARVALATWLASRSMTIFAQMGVLSTTDAPAALMWLVAIICAHRAVVEEESPYWIGFGAAVGLGVLAKYSVAILYPSVLLFLFLTPHLRRHLIHPAFIAGMIVFFFSLFPLLKWNAEHRWVNAAHNGNHLLNLSHVTSAPRYVLELVAGQFALVGPIILPGILYALFVAVREWKQDDRVCGLLLFTTVPLGGLICLVALNKRVYPNWPMPVYIGGLILLAYLLANYRIVSQRATRLIRPAILCSAAVTTIAYLVFWGVHFGVRVDLLPTRKLVGWHQLGTTVDRLMSVSVREGRRPEFVVAPDYHIASEIEFYTKPGTEVFCANVRGRRMNQYDIRDGWASLRDRDAIIVLKETTVDPELARHFREITPLAESLPVTFANRTVRTFHFFKAAGYDGEPQEVPLTR